MSAEFSEFKEITQRFLLNEYVEAAFKRWEEDEVHPARFLVESAIGSSLTDKDETFVSVIYMLLSLPTRELSWVGSIIDSLEPTIEAFEKDGLDRTRFCMTVSGSLMAVMKKLVQTRESLEIGDKMQLDGLLQSYGLMIDKFGKILSKS